MILPEINLVVQFSILVVVLLSMQLRRMSKFSAHGYTMIGALIVWTVLFVSVIAAVPNDPMFTTHPTQIWASTFYTAAFLTHLSLALLSFGASTWLVALWFRKTDFPSKSRIQAIVTTVGWSLAFVIGIWLFITLN